MQVRVHGDDAVEALRQQLADHALADGFTRRERDVLAHVAQVRGDQRHAGCAERSRGGGREHQLDELLVGAVEAAADRHRRRQVRRQREPGLAVGEAMHFDDPAGQARRGRQRRRLGRVLRKPEQHQNST